MPEDRRVILAAVTAPGSGTAVTPEGLLRHFASADGPALALRLLREALESGDPVDVECALIVTSMFGATLDHQDQLLQLAAADWHHKHEDVVSELSRLRTPAAVPALEHAARWVPSYLEYDESRALATKAIWGLGRIPGEEAGAALRRLLDSDDEIVREEAGHQIERRNGT